MALPGQVAPTAEPFIRMLQQDALSIDEVRRIGFYGVPDEYRATAWKLLLDYLPLKRSAREAELARKRKQYRIFLEEVTTKPGEDGTGEVIEAPAPVPPPTPLGGSVALSRKASSLEMIRPSAAPAVDSTKVADAAGSAPATDRKAARAGGDASAAASTDGGDSLFSLSGINLFDNSVGLPRRSGAAGTSGGGAGGGGGSFDLFGSGVAGSSGLREGTGVSAGAASTPSKPTSASAASLSSGAGASDAPRSGGHTHHQRHRASNASDVGDRDMGASGLGGSRHLAASSLAVMTVCDDPLSVRGERNSKWAEWHRDEELRGEIEKDILRTAPGLHFFADPAKLAAMSRILFVYAKLNAGVRYVQGMNELLAPIWMVMAQEKVSVAAAVTGTPLPQVSPTATAATAAADAGSSSASGAGSSSSSSSAAAAAAAASGQAAAAAAAADDAPSAAVAASVTASAVSGSDAQAVDSAAREPAPAADGSGSDAEAAAGPDASSSHAESSGAGHVISSPAERLVDPGDAEADAFFCFMGLMAEVRDVFIKAHDNSATGVRGMLNKYGVILSRREPAVAAHLARMRLDHQFYAFRWITTLLCREFAMPDVLMLWDCLLSDPFRFSFLLHTCAGMVRLQREALLSADFGGCMRLLQNYPTTDFGKLMAAACAVREEEGAFYAAAQAERERARSGNAAAAAPAAAAAASGAALSAGAAAGRVRAPSLRVSAASAAASSGSGPSSSSAASAAGQRTSSGGAAPTSPATAASGAGAGRPAVAIPAHGAGSAAAMARAAQLHHLAFADTGAMSPGASQPIREAAAGASDADGSGAGADSGAAGSGSSAAAAAVAGSAAGRSSRAGSAVGSGALAAASSTGPAGASLRVATGFDGAIAAAAAAAAAAAHEAFDAPAPAGSSSSASASSGARERASSLQAVREASFARLHGHPAFASPFADERVWERAAWEPDSGDDDDDDADGGAAHGGQGRLRRVSSAAGGRSRTGSRGIAVHGHAAGGNGGGPASAGGAHSLASGGSQGLNSSGSGSGSMNLSTFVKTVSSAFTVTDPLAGMHRRDHELKPVVHLPPGAAPPADAVATGSASGSGPSAARSAPVAEGSDPLGAAGPASP